MHMHVYMCSTYRTGYAHIVIDIRDVVIEFCAAGRALLR
jgi:hypothetical protein